MGFKIISSLILILGIINLVRIVAYMVGSDIYTIKQHFRGKQRRRSHTPAITAVVPAHNESSGIEACLSSLMASRYPRSRLQIVVINDGSTDDTAAVVRKFIKEHRDSFAIKLVSQKNRGKAAGLNRAVQRHATGRIIVCLDADSLVAPDAIRNGAQHFRDRKVVAMASNVNILEDGSVLSLVQRMEYLVGYNMKKAQNTYNIEYIVGGIGSFFRKTMLEKVNYYDSNTMTEDIDLTMKIIGQGNKRYKIAYGADCITYTQAAPTLKSLITQRYRWKYGRLQTFLKNRAIFFNRGRHFNRWLTCFILPFALAQEVFFGLEPVFLGYILYSCIRYQDALTFAIACLLITSYISLNIWSTKHLKNVEKLRLTAYAPACYLLLYVLSLVEYAALLKSVVGLHKLPSSIRANFTVWTSPERVVVK